MTHFFYCGFSVLIKLPDGKPFIVWCFVVRIVEATGCAAGLTAMYTLIAVTFPDRVAQMIVSTICEPYTSKPTSCRQLHVSLFTI